VCVGTRACIMQACSSVIKSGNKFISDMVYELLTRGLRHLCHISILRDSGSRTQDLGFRIQDSEDSSESIRGLRVYIKGDLTLVCLLDSCLCILNSLYTLSFTLIPITTCAPILTSHQHEYEVVQKVRYMLRVFGKY
jgi:hypothetical protein